MRTARRTARNFDSENSTQQALKDLLGMEELRLAQIEQEEKEAASLAKQVAQEKQEKQKQARILALKQTEQQKQEAERAKQDAIAQRILNEKKELAKIEVDAQLRKEALLTQHQLEIAKIQNNQAIPLWTKLTFVFTVILSTAGIFFIHSSLKKDHLQKITSLNAQKDQIVAQKQQLFTEKEQLASLLRSEQKNNRELKSQLSIPKSNLMATTKKTADSTKNKNTVGKPLKHKNKNKNIRTKNKPPRNIIPLDDNPLNELGLVL